MDAVIKRSKYRPDWFVWWHPDPLWCQAFAGVPGFQWTSNGLLITKVEFHLSHLHLIPQHLLQGLQTHEQGSMPASTLTRILRQYQANDLPFLRTRRATLLAYEMRLGKTALTTVAHDPVEGILVVVGPLASRDVWRTWIHNIHGYRPLVLQGRTNVEPQPGYPAYFVHYEVLGAHVQTLARERIGTLVLDEVHMIQNRKAQRTAAVAALAPHAKRIVALSGTPMWGSPDSLYSILHMLTPGAWGGHHDFGVHYCGAQPGAHGWNYKSVSNPEELQERLGEVMLRRTWKDVAPQLPPTTRVVEPVDVSLAQLASIEAATMKAALARGTNTVVGYLATLRRKLAEVKIKTAVATAQQALADGHKVVLWHWHREVGDKLQTTLREAGVMVNRIRSEDDATVREIQTEAFRVYTQPAVMVVGIAVGGVAIDLSCSDYAIFAELDWTPAMIYQAEMRTFNPARPHVVVYLHADTPVETKLVHALGVREGFQTSLNLGFDEIARFVLDTAPSEAWDGNPFKEITP